MTAIIPDEGIETIKKLMPEHNDWEKKFIKEFCNDHNGYIRWLRGQNPDEVIDFIRSLLDQTRKETLEAVQKQFTESVLNLTGHRNFPGENPTPEYDNAIQDAIRHFEEILNRAKEKFNIEI